MTSVAVRFYKRKFQEEVKGAFLHTVRKMGSSPAPSSETSRPSRSWKLWRAALMEFLASRFGFDLAESVTELYTRKPEKLAQP